MWRFWIRLVSGPTMPKTRCVAFQQETEPLAFTLQITAITVIAQPCLDLSYQPPDTFSHYLQWMWKQKIAAKGESAGDINHWDEAPLIRAILLKVKEQRAPLMRHWVK